MHAILRTSSLVGIALLFAGCITERTLTEDLLTQTNQSEASAPLGGEALLQRKLELDRAVRDLEHFHATLTSLTRRGERGPTVMFREFVDFYLAKHVLPMLEGEWQSRHPEVAVHDANARFVVAELWWLMGASSRTEQMIEEIEQRYRGRHSMIVAYPVGGEATLGEGLERLRNL